MPARYQPLVQKWGNLCPAINPALLAAQLYQESGWNPSAQSPAAAQGIAQFIPGTWATHGIDGDKDGDRDVWDPADAIPSAASYDCELAGYVKNVPGDPTDNMLAAYNAGAYARHPVRAGCPPYRETQNYVKTITTLEKSFAAPVGRVRALAAGGRGHLLRAEEARHAVPVGRQRHGRAGRAVRLLGADPGRVPRRSDIELPRVANDQYNAGPHPSRDELLPGDLVFFSDDLDQLAGHPPRRASTWAAAT